MFLNKEQVIEFCHDKDIEMVVYAPTLVRVHGVYMPTTLLLPNEYVESFVEMVCKYMLIAEGVAWQEVQFSINPSGNTMFLDVNSPTVKH